MERLYRKLPNGKYESAGLCRDKVIDIPDGLYFSQKNRTTSVTYWLGNVKKEPVDLGMLIQMMSYDNELACFLSSIQDEQSEEYKNLKSENGFINSAPKIYNISMQDLAVCILRFLYNKYLNEEEEDS